jgi:diaminopimelate epimerase
LHLEFGPHIEKHPLFPRKTNVEFVRILDSGTALMNVWERGSGETFACGTGACAVAVVGVLKGVLDNRSTIRLKGGDLDIEWNGMGYPVFMTGPAVSVFKGIINI